MTPQLRDGKISMTVFMPAQRSSQFPCDFDQGVFRSMIGMHVTSSLVVPCCRALVLTHYLICFISFGVQTTASCPREANLKPKMVKSMKSTKH